MTLSRQMLAGLAVSALTVAGCSEPTVSDRGVEVALTVDRSVLRPGDNAQLTVTATNRGTRTVSINGSACPGAFVVRDADGAEAGPGPRMCTLAAVVRVLAPGETYTFRDTWALDGTGGTWNTPRLVPPGVYALQGRVFGKDLRAESAPVAIRVETASPAGSNAQ